MKFLKYFHHIYKILKIKIMVFKNNGCHDISTKTISMYNLCIGYNNGNAYRINFAFMPKNDALNLIKNAVIIDKKKEYYKAKNNNFLSVHSIKMSSRKIKFGDKEVYKKEFYLSKQAISLDSVDLNKFVSNKWKINDTTYKYLCGYLNNDVIQPLCVILPQMSGYIKYFDDGGKNMSFVTDDEEVYKSITKYGKLLENF